MGTSTNAILAFGFDIGEELPDSLLPEDEDEFFDFEEWLCGRLGLEWSEGRDDDYWLKRRAAIEAFPVDLVAHCSGDYPMYFLAVRGTESTALRGTPQRVQLTPPSEAAIICMREFCAEHGIEWREPDWHIFSMWH
ncbi:MAG TPA: hypothetical protein VIT62_10960 [Lysobacter sp.]